MTILSAHQVSFSNLPHATGFHRQVWNFHSIPRTHTCLQEAPESHPNHSQWIRLRCIPENRWRPCSSDDGLWPPHTSPASVSSAVYDEPTEGFHGHIWSFRICTHGNPSRTAPAVAWLCQTAFLTSVPDLFHRLLDEGVEVTVLEILLLRIRHVPDILILAI